MGQKQTKQGTPAFNTPHNNSDDHESIIGRPAPPRHMYHISELFDLNELSQQAQENDATRRTARLVSNSNSGQTSFDDAQGVDQDGIIYEDRPPQLTSIAHGPGGSQSISGATTVPTQLITMHCPEVRNTSDTLLLAESRETPTSLSPIISSPSGQLLDFETYIARPDRPLTIKERQVRIKAELRRKVQSCSSKPKRSSEKGTSSRGCLGWARCW